MITDLGESCSQRRHELERTHHSHPPEQLGAADITINSCPVKTVFAHPKQIHVRHHCRGLWVLVWSTMDHTDSHTSEIPLQEPGLAVGAWFWPCRHKLSSKEQAGNFTQEALSLLAGAVPRERPKHHPLWGCSFWFQDCCLWIRHGVFYPKLTSHRCSRACDKSLWLIFNLPVLSRHTFPSPHPYFSWNPGQQGGRESSVHLFITNIDKQHVKALLTWKVLAYLTKTHLISPGKQKLWEASSSRLPLHGK